jgi:hypothetical protein
MPDVGRHDLFEQEYIGKLKALMAPYGQLVGYERDRAALDLGLHLYEQPVVGDAHVSQVRVWFQAKGIRSATMAADQLTDIQRVAVRDLPIEHIRYWFAHPEPIYLVVYLEALDRFLAEDVRDLVEHEGGPRWLADAQRSQDTTTLHVSSASTLEGALQRMPSHRSLRLDGPEFRGRPLGHRMDPLRCELDVLEPESFQALVSRLLEAHEFRISREVDIASLLNSDIGSVSAMVGRLYLTYEWLAPIETEFGVGPESDFRIEAPPDWAHGDVLIIVHSRFLAAPQQTEATRELVSALRDDGICRALVFFNASDLDAAKFGSWRTTLEPMVRAPQGLGSLAFNVLTATNVYLEFLDRLRWRFANIR